MANNTQKANETKKATPRKTTQKRSSTNKKQSFNERLAAVIQRVKDDKNKEVLGDKTYTKVSVRKGLFREEFGFDVKIITTLKEHDSTFTFALFESEIQVLHEHTKEWEVVSNGHSYETRNSSELNLHNFIENAETSAIGRALSNLGIDGGDLPSDAELLKQANKTSKDKTVTKVTGEKNIKMGGISESQKKEINKLAKELNHDIKSILKTYKCSKLEDLSSEQAEKTIKLLKAGLDDDIIWFDK